MTQTIQDGDSFGEIVLKKKALGTDILYAWNILSQPKVCAKCPFLRKFKYILDGDFLS